MADNLIIILVEDNIVNQKQICSHLRELFPNCTIETLVNGIQAVNYLLSPNHQYDLVILDGKLKNTNSFMASLDGPDVAKAMQEKGIKVPVVLFTKDHLMLQKFDEVFGRRLPEIEKPCRLDNVAVVLKPLVEAMPASDEPEPSVAPAGP